MSKIKPYIPLVNNFSANGIPPESLGVGPWHCISDFNDEHYQELLEAYKGIGDYIVFRISGCSEARIHLGKSVTLDKEKAIKVRDRLTDLISILD